MGDISQLRGSDGGENQDKVRSFELFRRQISESEILTFDGVLSRAKWALESLADAHIVILIPG